MASDRKPVPPKGRKQPARPGTLPATLTKALNSRIEEKAMREGLSHWLARMALDKSATRVTSGPELLAFLGDAIQTRLLVVLKGSLKSDSGYVVEASLTATGFTLSDVPGQAKNPRVIKYADVALYRVPDSGKIAAG